MSASDKDHTAWLKKTMAEPENLDLRLEFAQWLKGRNFRHLPELIRLQCEESRLKQTGKRRDQRQALALKKEAVELLKDHGDGILRYFGIEQKGTYVDSSAMVDFEDYPLASIEFHNGLPTHAQVRNDGSMNKVPSVLKKVLLSDIYTDQNGPAWEELAKITAMKNLVVSDWKGSRTMPAFKSLQSLELIGNLSLLQYNQITSQPKLRELVINGHDAKPETLVGMQAFPELVRLELPPETTNLKGMPRLPKLKQLKMRMYDVNDLKLLKQQPSFEHLHIMKDSDMTDFEEIASICNPEKLLVLHCDESLIDLSPLASFTNLQSFALHDGIIDEDDLAWIPDSIKELWLPQSMTADVDYKLGQGHWPNLETFNGEKIPKRKAVKQARVVRKPEAVEDTVEEVVEVEVAAAVAPEHEYVEKPSYLEEFEQLEQWQDRLAKFRRPSGLNRTR